MFNFRYNLKHLNNGRLTGVNAMPAKDLTSESDGAFASDRKAYSNIVATNIATPAPNKVLQKKWIGGCRDASEVSYRRRIEATGSSLNPDGGAIAFTSTIEKNTSAEALNALKRCRNKGNCVPPKVRASKRALNVPTPIWKPPNLVRSKYHAVLTKETPMQPKKINNVNGFS